MKIHICVTALLAVFAFTAFGALAADFEKVQKERKALMQSNSKDNKALRAAAKAGDMAKVEEIARELASNFAKTANPCLFPKGSGEGTRAKPAVWDNWEGFEERAQAARKLALAVAAQAKAGQTGEATKLASSLSKQACNGCHKTFRGPKKK